MTGDVLRCLAKLPDESVQCVVTSPPYWGLRDYGTATWKGGDPDCDHGAAQVAKRQAGCQTDVDGGIPGSLRDKPRTICNCGARRIDAQIGLEPTPDFYVAKMVAVFAEVRRVLRDDGTCWVNLGDSYASAPPGNTTKGVSERSTLHGVNGLSGQYRETLSRSVQQKRNTVIDNLKPKDLVGIPWRVAFALQADGWYLRSDIIWHKPNPMPESVRDRPTKSHEYVFLLTKRARYYYDADAVREKTGNEMGPEEYAIRTAKGATWQSGGLANGAGFNKKDGGHSHPNGRNSRSVWTITPKPFKGAHFATFPPQLVERCVKAGTSERGACPSCGAPWERVTERTAMILRRSERTHEFGRTRSSGTMLQPPSCSTLGFRPTCSCPAADPVPCVVLDPFSGAGTVPLVSKQLTRDAIGIDLNPSYNRMARKRIAAV